MGAGVMNFVTPIFLIPHKLSSFDYFDIRVFAQPVSITLKAINNRFREVLERFL